MKKTLLILLLILSGYFASGQAPVIEWQKSLGGSDEEYAQCIKQTSDGGYIVTGATKSNDADVTGNHLDSEGNTSWDWWVVKLNSSGNITWKKTFGGSGTDISNSVTLASDGGYIIAGTTTSGDGDVTDFFGTDNGWVMKLSASGEIIWKKCFYYYIVDGANAGDFLSGVNFVSVKATPDGGAILAGTGYMILVFGVLSFSYDDWSVVKINAAGQIEWNKEIGASWQDDVYAIEPTADGGYIVGGTTASADEESIFASNHGSFDYYITKLNAAGDTEWQKLYGGPNDEIAYDVKQTTDGGYIIAGLTQSNSGDVTGNHSNMDNLYADYWVVKTDATGNIVWQKCFGGTYEENASSVSLTNDGGYIVAGYSTSIDGNVTAIEGTGSSYWAVKLNENGDIEWEKTMGGGWYDHASSIQQTTDSGYIVAGYSWSDDFDVTGNHGLGDFWVVKLAANNLAIESLEQNNVIVYPDPTSSILNLQLKDNTLIDKIIITDLCGKIILEKNQDTSKINVDNFANGMYIIQAFSEAKAFRAKFIKN